jgi:putative iron-only hydrogenase system regulator
VETRIALIGIMVEDLISVKDTNELLHQYNQYMVGRLGIPYKEKGVNIISIVLDAPENIISALSGKLGMIKGITVKTMLAKTK